MAIMLVALIMLHRKRFFWAIVFSVCTLLIHKMAFVFFLFMPFYYFFRKGISLKMASLLIVASSLFGILFQTYFLLYTANMDLGGAYQSYASRSIGTSFLDGAWKLAFEQIILGVMMVLFNKPIKLHIAKLRGLDADRLKLVWLMCLFDMMCIPVNYIMGVWRGYTFFYLPRLVMWGEVIYLFQCKYVDRSLRVPSDIVITAAFIAWMVFRFYHMWEDSNLMPYVFELFI